MAGNRTRLPIIGRFETDQAQSPFLSLVEKSGQAQIGGIDSQGYRFGTLAAGDFVGVTQLTGDYAVQTTDNGFLLSVSSSSPVTITLPAIAPVSPFYIQVQNTGSGTVTVTPNGLQMDGSSSNLIVNSDQGVLIASNGSAYFTQRGIGGSGGNAFAGVNAQTGDYTALSGDTGKLITFTKSSAVALTLPASAPSSTWFAYVQNRGTGDLTINRNGNQLDGGTTNVVLHQYQGIIVYSDGTNYFTQRGVTGIGNTNVQTNDYTALPGDTGKLIVMNKGTAVQLTLPATAPSPAWFIMVQNIGAGTLTVSRNGNQIDGGTSNLTLTQNQGLIVYSDGTNYFTERGSGSTASNVAIKPAQATGIQFVAVATGNDSNDGYSWGTAKLTIMAAYDALPASGGTIFVAGQGIDASQWPAATSTSGQGIWIMGPNDPNYASPPVGWRKAKNGGNAQVAFIGVPSSASAANDMAGNLAGFLGGDTSNPAIWLSNVTGITFRNFYTQYPKSFAWISVTSNGTKSNLAGGSDIVFDNCGANVANGAEPTKGPVVDIGPNTFWLRLSNCGLQANASADVGSKDRAAVYIDEGKAPDASITATSLTSNVATYTCNNEYTAGQSVTVTGCTNGGTVFNVVAATILSASLTSFTVSVTHADIGPASESGTASLTTYNEASGILYFENVHLTGGGGIQYVNKHEGTAGHFIKNCEMEGTGDSQPIYQVLNNNGTFRASIFLSETISDSGTNPPAIAIAAGVPNWSVSVYGVCGFNNMDLAGPMSFFGLSGLQSISTGKTQLATVPVGITSPQAQGQKGSIFGKNLDQNDNGRRTFLSYPRFTNLATQLPSTWVAVGAGGITASQTAPDGTTNAGLVTGADPNADGARCFQTSGTYNAGDYLYFGVWMRSTQPILDDVQSPAPGIRFVFGTSGLAPRIVCGSYGASQVSEDLECPAVVQDDGSWQWIWGVLKCTTGSAVTYSPRIFLPAQTGHDIQYYAPVYCHITSASVQTVPTTTVDTAGNSGATQSGNIVTIKTTTDHKLIPGQLIVIKGVSASGYNGEFVVRTVPTSATFTYYNTTTGLGTSGSGSVIPGNDSEVAEWALNNVPYGDDLAAGPMIASPRGVPLAFGGTGDNFHAILDHSALTANHTLSAPNATGTLVLLEAANSFSALQSFGSSIKVGTSGATISQIAVFTATLTPSPVSANVSAEEEYTVTGIATTDKVFLGNYPAPTAGTVVGGVRASNTNKISINWGNLTASPKTPAAGDYTFVAIRS